ncbi:MAG: hypothetical protein P8012_10185 [Desulfobacterales bacterium]
MKKIVCLVIILSALMLFACGKTTVEDAAKDYVKKQCAFDNNVKIDTSKLKYSVEKKEGSRAVVKVSGTINFDGRLFLVKQGNKWKVGKKEDIYAAPKKATSNSEQKAVVSHTAQTTPHEQPAHK